MILEGGNIYNHSGLSRNWLHQDMLPGNVQMRRQVVYNATGYHYQEGCQFILVDHGGGCLIVNGDAYSLEAGSCCLLFVHHFYSIKPSQSVPLTLLSCLFSYSTYTFLTTIPAGRECFFRWHQFPAWKVRQRSAGYVPSPAEKNSQSSVATEHQ